jgi:hypothetical protein
MSEDQNRTYHDKFMLRLPDGMRELVRQSAENSGRSMNAEIVQRLKQSFDEAAGDTLRLDLPSEAWNHLMMDAGIAGIQMEERALQIIQSAYAQPGETNPALARAQDAVMDNIDLSEQVEAMKRAQDLDFLLYYNKVVQLLNLTQAILMDGGVLPSHIRTIAADLNKLGQAEIQTLADRHDEAMFKKLMEQRVRKLREEGIEGDAESDIDSAINIRPRPQS